MVISESGGTGGGGEFRGDLPEAAAGGVVGTVTGWGERPGAVQKEDKGGGTATLGDDVLSPGDHEFNYLVGGSHWLADYAASGVKRNGYGGWVSQLHVPMSDVGCRMSDVRTTVQVPARRRIAA